jgi:hypothetical protein
MSRPTDKQLEGILVAIISDGFNRALGALAEAKAIDTSKLTQHYKGMGSKYYDLVTEQVTYTAKYGAQGVRKLFSDNK